LKAAQQLVKEGFKVMVYCSDDPIQAQMLEAAGCVAVMPSPTARRGGRARHRRAARPRMDDGRAGIRKSVASSSCVCATWSRANPSTSSANASPDSGYGDALGRALGLRAKSMRCSS